MVKYIYGAAAVLVICGAIAFSSYHYGYAEAKLFVTNQYEEKLRKQISQAEEAEALLRKKNHDALGAKENEINKLTARVSSLRSELLKRPSRQNNPLPPSSPATCTGRELYREDGEFLAGEASTAERVRIERDYYYGQYEQARQQLERLKNGED